MTIRMFDNEEYLALTNVLRIYHSLFYKLWLIGKPRFTDSIPTAAVAFNKEGKFLDFMVNYDFWQTLNENQKAFIISHECQHIIREHGKRFISNSANELELANIAMDITINHDLVKHYNFSRSEIDPDNFYCWIDTVFKNITDIKEDQSFEYYYNKLVKHENEIQKQNLVDVHNKPESGESDESEHNDNDLSDIIKDNLTEEELSELENVKGERAGNGAGGLSVTMNKEKIKVKRKWESVIKKWSLKYLVEHEKEISQWVFPHRRHTLLEKSLMIPSDMEIDDHNKDDRKIDVFFFLDTSGSCRSLASRFWQATKSLNPEKFNLRLYCFDTRVYKTTLESGKLYGFGGTSFDILSNEVNKVLNHEPNLKDYAVFVLTDGYGNSLHPTHPDKWFWFLSTSYTEYIPKNSHIHKLANYE